MTTDNIKLNLKGLLKYVEAFFKWIIISILVGVAGGVLGSVFHKSIDFLKEIKYNTLKCLNMCIRGESSSSKGH